MVPTISLVFPFPITSHAQSFPHYTRDNLDGAWYPKIAQWYWEEITGGAYAYQDILQVPAVSAERD